MKYYLMLAHFITGEGSFTEREPKRLKYYHSTYMLQKKRAYVEVNKLDNEREMSDFLKKGIGMLASNKVQKIFFEYGFSGIQFIPIDLENHNIYTDFSFINPIAHYDVLDPIASKAEKYSDILGGYTRVFDEIIDKKKFKQTNIISDCFTLSTYKDPYYVNETVKNALEAAGVTGVEFLPMEFSS